MFKQLLPRMLGDWMHSVSIFYQLLDTKSKIVYQRFHKIWISLFSSFCMLDFPSWFANGIYSPLNYSIERVCLLLYVESLKIYYCKHKLCMHTYTNNNNAAFRQVNSVEILDNCKAKFPNSPKMASMEKRKESFLLVARRQFMAQFY